MIWFLFGIVIEAGSFQGLTFGRATLPNASSGWVRVALGLGGKSSLISFSSFCTPVCLFSFCLGLVH